MVYKLRKKFVIVTTSLMIVVFGGFLLINTLYNSYWNNMEIVSMLDWIAYSGIFTKDNPQVDNEDFVLEMFDDDSPILGVILDSDNNIVSIRSIGQASSLARKVRENEDIIRKMCEYKSSEYKVSGLYYSYKEISNGRSLLVIMNGEFQATLVLRILGVSGLAIAGILALIGITFFLSRFVTGPAEKSLLREKQFISDASHELKTPLGAIMINAQVLESEDADNLYIRNIISESDRMNRLIERLLTLAKLDEMGKESFANISLSEICEEISLTYESVAFEKGIVYSYEIEDGITLKGDEDEIRQLLAILIDNAIKNTQSDGQINIVCKMNKKNKEILVSNTGQGIHGDDLPHVFERFYTSDKSRGGNSFGLGLAIAKTIVKRHGGTIEAESTWGKNAILKCIF